LWQRRMMTSTNKLILPSRLLLVFISVKIYFGASACSDSVVSAK
jgi:hypothetical protein